MKAKTNRLLKLVSKDAGDNVLAGFKYTLDNVGNRTAIELSNGEKINYRFDGAYRLTGERRIDATNNVIYLERFRYDAAGNRTRQVKNDVVANYTYNSNNQLTKTVSEGVTTRYTYDANGNQIRSAKPGEVTRMQYDELNRMTEWRQTGGGQPRIEQNVYRGAEWHRASTTANNITTSYLYDGDNVVADIAGGNVSKTYVTPFLDQNLSMTDTATSQTYYYTQDGLGSVRTLTDATGAVVNSYDYEAFGAKYSPNTTESISQRYQYTGREASAVGAPMYYRYRMYDAAMGRFGRRDPVGYENNEMGNLYEYMYCSPLMYGDAYGLGEDDEVHIVLVPKPHKDDEGDTLKDEFEEVARKAINRDKGSNGWTVLEVKDIEDANSKVNGVKCKCVKTLEIVGHGNSGLQNVGSKSDPFTKGEGRIGVKYQKPGLRPKTPSELNEAKKRNEEYNKKHPGSKRKASRHIVDPGGYKAYGFDLFDDIDWCSPCKIILRGCNTGSGKRGKALYEKIKEATGCDVEGFSSTTYADKDNGLPGLKTSPHGPDVSYPKKK